MRMVCNRFWFCFGLACVLAGSAPAQVKVELEPLGPDGETLGGSVSPQGDHVAVLVVKGSRFVVSIDGVEGPRLDALLTRVMGGPVQGGGPWMGQVPILFSNEGGHCAYSAKMGDEYVVMLDGKELARGPI